MKLTMDVTTSNTRPVCTLRIDTSLSSHTRSVHFTAPEVGLQPISYLFLAFIHSWKKFRHQIQTLLLCSLYSLFVDNVLYIYLNPISLDPVIALLQSENIYDKQSCLLYLYLSLRRSKQHPQFTHLHCCEYHKHAAFPKLPYIY